MIKNEPEPPKYDIPSQVIESAQKILMNGDIISGRFDIDMMESLVDMINDDEKKLYKIKKKLLENGFILYDEVNFAIKPTKKLLDYKTSQKFRLEAKSPHSKHKYGITEKVLNLELIKIVKRFYDRKLY